MRGRPLAAAGPLAKSTAYTLPPFHELALAAFLNVARRRRPPPGHLPPRVSLQGPRAAAEEKDAPRFVRDDSPRAQRRGRVSPMRVPESLSSLVYDGIVDQVVRPLMSGKEAQVYLVLSGGYECVAKIYKDAQHRTFQNRATYTEGRKVRNSRDQRAIEKRTRHGNAKTRPPGVIPKSR